MPDFLEDLNFRVIRSKRKTICIQMKPDGSFIIKAPDFATDNDINELIRAKKSWIRRAQEKAREQAGSVSENSALSMEEIQALADKALKVIPERVKFYAAKAGVTYGRITIRNQRSRWGSCSSKGNLNFNCLLMLAPPEVLDSVVVHELCHRLEMNHSKKFYDEVIRVFPDYWKWDRWLKDNGNRIMARMRG